MLQISRDNTKAIIGMETDLPFNCEGTKVSVFKFEFEMQSPAKAELLVRYISARLSVLVEDAQRKAYEQGWKDAKSKKPKTDLFSGLL